MKDRCEVIEEKHALWHSVSLPLFVYAEGTPDV